MSRPGFEISQRLKPRLLIGMSNTYSSFSQPRGNTKKDERNTREEKTQDTENPSQGTQAAERDSMDSSSGRHVNALYRRRHAHQPNIPKADVATNTEVYVLTLLTDRSHHLALTKLRDQYFPKHLNKLGAHITLFHALPGSRLAAIRTSLAECVNERSEFPISTSSAFSLGNNRYPHGVAIGTTQQTNNMIGQLRDSLREQWKTFLSEQDARTLRKGAAEFHGFHYTIMNKVDDIEEVKDCLDEVQARWCNHSESRDGIAKGLTLWRYEKGFWRDPCHFKFGQEIKESANEGV